LTCSGRSLALRPEVVEQAGGPEGARGVLQVFGVQLLAAEAGPLERLDDGMEEALGEVGDVLVGRALHDDRPLLLLDGSHPRKRLGSRRDDAAGILSEAQAEHQHFECFGITPGAVVSQDAVGEILVVSFDLKVEDRPRTCELPHAENVRRSRTPLSTSASWDSAT
jgi:hypothetical protein